MKKIFAMLLIFGLASAAFAENKSGTLAVDLSGSYGLGMMSGTVGAIVGTTVTNESKSGYFDVTAGLKYFVIDDGALKIFTGYSTTPLSVKYSGTSNGTSSVNTEFFDIGIGYRHYFGGLFAGIGYIYGIKLDKWKANNNSGSYDANTKYTKNNSTLYFELGYAIPLGENISLDLAVKYNLGLVPVLDNSSGGGLDKWKANALALNVAVGYKF